jgi:hypothetical protein
MYTLDFQDETGTSTIEFNLCEETARRCPDMVGDHANIINSVGTCNHLSRVIMEGEQKPGTLSLISETNPGLGVVMNYEGGNMCNETSHFSLQVQINCNANLDKTTYALDKESLKNPCDPRVIMNSPHACPVLSTGPLSQFLKDYAYWIGVPMILIGGYLAFVGGRFPGTTLFIFSTLAIALTQLFLMFLFVLPKFSPVWTVPVIFFVNLGMGLGMGYGAAKWPKTGVMIMGFSLGSLLGFLIYWSFLSASVTTTMAKSLTILGVALFTAVIYLVLFDFMVIITSAVFGAYILIRVSSSFCLNIYLQGVTMYTGGYVDEFTVILATSNGDLSELKWAMYLYWILMVLMAMGSIWAQLKDRREHLEAYAYKFHANTQFETYRSMRERITRFSGNSQNQGYSSADNSHGDEDEASHLNHNKHH